MENMQPLITGDLARAGRALAQVSFEIVAERAEVGPEQLRSFERGTHDLDDEERVRLSLALEDYGIRFIPDDADGGYGVRLNFGARTVKRLENWENEGGPAYEDDV